MLWLLRLGGRPVGSMWDYIYCWEQWLIALSTTSIARRKPNRREIMRLKNKMYEEKINFLTNISHELRTPLTLICAPLKRIINKESDKQDVEKLLVPGIYKQAYQMKNIIDMVLDVRKLKKEKDMLHILPHPLE